MKIDLSTYYKCEYCGKTALVVEDMFPVGWKIGRNISKQWIAICPDSHVSGANTTTTNYYSAYKDKSAKEEKIRDEKEKS